MINLDRGHQIAGVVSVAQSKEWRNIRTRYMIGEVIAALGLEISRDVILTPV
jgi:hypothetical protein